MPDPPPQAHPKSSAATKPSPAGGVPAGEELVTATSDTDGYHLYAASAGDNWRWHALATLQPGGYSDEPWTGEHCTTGDGRYVIAVVAPWSANNSDAGIAAGGLAYAIDTHTGTVRPLASGLMLSYFNPGCGTGSTVALSRYADIGQTRTQILTVDAATGATRTTPVIPGQITSAIPVDGTLYAAEAHRLVAIGAHGAMTTVSSHDGQVFDLTPNAAGGVDYVVEDQAATSTYRLADSRVSRIDAKDSGTATAGSERSRSGSVAVKPSSAKGRADIVGTDGTLIGGGTLPSPAASVKTLPSAPAPASTKTTATATAMGTATAAATATAAVSTSTTAAAVPPDGGGDTGATCAVPRNDPAYQAPQPSDQQIDWALNLAGQYGLPQRASSYANLNTGAYDPSADFPLPAPFDGTAGIPRQIMEGIFAQESNWKQASPHAPAGLAGNPLVADYYGIYNRQNTTGVIDFPLADCGYGLGQITDMMRLATPGSAPSTLQKRVALDYAENAAATAQTLAQKWDGLTAAGITVGHANPSEIEDWYFAIWAYNSGVNPQASTGNTTGCTPGPSCTDAAGDWGLGWTNNPANPTYNPLRHPFLHDALGNLTYNDASTPQNWPYQEKVFGWIESGQYEGDGATLKYSPTHDYASGTGFFLSLPGVYDFCNTSDDCDPAAVTQPCGHNADTDPLQWHCWWHQAAPGFCASGCHAGNWNYTVSQAEPTVADPFPSICSPPANFTDVLLVDDSSTEANLAGCHGMAAPNTTMVWIPNQDSAGGPFGDVDLHQLGTGYGGRSLFTHLEPPSASAWGGTMVWTPFNLDYDVYDVEVFVPGLGAAGTVTYTITSFGRTVATVQVNQNDYNNQWVSLGSYYLAPGSNVSTTNIVSGADGNLDVAFDAVAFRPVSSYVSLGDSYSSGEGTGVYDAGTDVPGTNMCHRSSQSYARVWAATYGAAGVPMIQLACSGAVIDELTTTGRYGEPAQIPATPRHAVQVFLTIGGNDAQFGPVLANCLRFGGCEAFYTGNDTNNLDVRMEGLVGRLRGAYQQLNARVPNAAVSVLTYPNIFAPTTTGTSCLFQTGLGLSARDIEWLISEANHLDNVIERATNPLLTPTSHFVVRDERWAFAGHDVCSASPDVNGLQLANPTTVKSESFHPNQAGYLVEATSIGSAGATAGNWSHYLSMRSPLPGTPDTATASALLSKVRLGTYNNTGWASCARGWFNQSVPTGGCTTPPAGVWETWPGVLGRCSSPLIVGKRDNDNAAYTPPANCATNTYADLVGATSAAFWYTPYDNPQATVTPNNANSQFKPDVDHVIPLKDAWSNGAAGWSQGLRYDFANDWRGIQLLTASATTNRSKQDKSIEEWQPPNTGYLCAYAEMWVAIKFDWNLQVDNTTVYTGTGPGNGLTELGYLQSVLSHC